MRRNETSWSSVSAGHSVVIEILLLLGCELIREWMVRRFGSRWRGASPQASIDTGRGEAEADSTLFTFVRRMFKRVLITIQLGFTRKPALNLTLLYILEMKLFLQKILDCVLSTF